jgi:uncharacterized protein
MLAALLLASCSGQTQRSVVTSLVEMRQENVVIQQWDLSCGAAALATILTYQHGLPVPEKTIAEAMLRRTDPLRVQVSGGFSLLDLKRFVDGLGYEGTGYGELTLENLTEFGPIIVPINTRGYNHFVVFRGVQDGRVVLADPAFGNWTMTVERFERVWQGNLGFIVEGKEGPAPPGRLALHNGNVLLPQASFVRQSVVLQR